MIRNLISPTLLSLFVLLTVLHALQARAQTIVDEWGSVKAPPAPELKPVKLDAATTALLVLDFSTKNCTPEKRARCATSLPKVAKILQAARAKKMTVIYGITAEMKPSDVAKDLAPKPGEEVVQGGPDRFLGTNLEKILKEKGVKSLIFTGTSSHGVILSTASTAAQKDYKVVVPVDGSSADTPYIEQYSAWHLLNAPGTRKATTLSRLDMIEF